MQPIKKEISINVSSEYKLPTERGTIQQRVMMMFRGNMKLGL